MRAPTLATAAALFLAGPHAFAQEPAPLPEPSPSTSTSTPTSTSTEPEYSAPPPVEMPRAPTARDRVVAYYTGIQIGIAPGIIFPTNGGDPGFLLSLYGGYGVETEPVLLIPGLHLTGAWPSGEFIGTATPALKVVLPVGAFAPYVEGGAGPGYVSVLKKTGIALRAGAGFSVHPSSRFAIGAGISYETITGTDVSFLGPVLILSF